MTDKAQGEKEDGHAVDLQRVVIKPDDCCQHCEGGWCKDGKAALTCEHALWPDNTDDKWDFYRDGVGCEKAL